MNCLGEPDENQSRSVDARQELDLRIGCAFTRFQTRYFQGKYGDLDSSVISYGPCQTPTLGFCVDRHDQITNHKPEAYWVLQVTVEASLEKRVNLEWDRVRCFDRSCRHVPQLREGQPGGRGHLGHYQKEGEGAPDCAQHS